MWTLLGLVGPSAGLLPWKTDLFRREMELNRLVSDELSGVVYLGHISNVDQLLLLDLPGKRLVECGSLSKGTLINPATIA